MSTKAVAAEFFEKLSSGDFAGGFASLSDTATWTIIGSTAISKTFTKSTMLSELVPMLSTFKVPAQLDVDEIISENDRAVVLAHVQGVGPHAPYQQKTYCFVLRIKDTQICEIVEYLDTVEVEQAIFGRKLVDADPA